MENKGRNYGLDQMNFKADSRFMMIYEKRKRFLGSRAVRNLLKQNHCTRRI